MRLQSEIREWFAEERPLAGVFHFVGIGGAGMSALARVLLHQGKQVSGSDLVESHVTRELAELRAKIFIGHSAKNVASADVVVVSDAVDLGSNPETTEARARNITLVRRSQLLGHLLRGYRVIAVTGSHGKSTATAILAQILADAELDPLAIVGAEVPAFGGSVRFGKGDIAVVEACEAYDGFHDISPDSVLLTNLEPEHLDYHRTWERLRQSVVQFCESSKGFPKLVYSGADGGAREVAERIEGAVPYALADGFEYSRGELRTPFGNFKLTAFGEHNALNCLGAAVMASHYGVSLENAISSAANATGCARRLERVALKNEILVYDDYAHHPTEIRATLKALREAHADKRLIVVFQPHLYSRTKDFLEEFAPAFTGADIVVITDIYPAREQPIPGISASLIVEHLEKIGIESFYVPSRHQLARKVAAMGQPGDVIVGMGAGNIDSFARALVTELKRKSEPLRVAVLCGGTSAEREVSLLSGAMVSLTLEAKGYRTQTLDPAELLLGKTSVEALVGPERPDIAFLALHGTGAEDGRIQGLLDLLELPFTGSGVAASALAMDKAKCKEVLGQAGLPVPKSVLVRHGESVPDFAVPCVVKPNSQGSTIGLTFVRDVADLPKAISWALKFDDAALVEELVEGVEISVPMLGDTALPAVEIRPKEGVYDFTAKYTPGETEEIVPARISEADETKARDYAARAHAAVGAEDLSRTDMIVTKNEIYVLEINTLPGFTMTSLLPKSAESAGINFDNLVEQILHSAMKRYGIAKK